MKNEPERIAEGGDFPRAACNCFKLGADRTKPGGLVQEVGQEMVWIQTVRQHAGFSQSRVGRCVTTSPSFMVSVRWRSLGFDIFISELPWTDTNISLCLGLMRSSIHHITL